MIQILNGYKDGWTGESKYYIGRQNKNLNLTKSSLANPYGIATVGSREAAIDKFEEYLKELIRDAEKGKKRYQIKALAQLIVKYKNGEDIALVCYCKPQACHGDVIARYIQKYAKLWDDDFLESIIS